MNQSKSDDPTGILPPLAEPSPTEHGGRVELRLLSDPQNTEAQKEASTSVVYAARWFTADQKMEGEVTVQAPEPGKAQPSISIQAPASLPDWLASFTTTLIRTTARSAQKESSWPRRLTRWRAAPGDEK